MTFAAWRPAWPTARFAPPAKRVWWWQLEIPGLRGELHKTRRQECVFRLLRVLPRWSDVKGSVLALRRLDDRDKCLASVRLKDLSLPSHTGRVRSACLSSHEN